MYKGVLRSWFFNVYVLPSKFEKSSTGILRLINRGSAKGLRTFPPQLCEKNEAFINTSLDNKNPANETVNESPPLEVNSKLAADGEIMPQFPKVSEPDATKPVIEKARCGKKGLLDLLGEMKVEVTNKRKLKSLKGRKEIFSIPKPRMTSMESTISMFQNATETTSQQSETLPPDLVAAASAAASSLPNPDQAESELLQQLRQHETITETQKKGDGNNIGVIIAEMKIGKNPNRSNTRPANQIRFDDDGRGYTPERGITGELDSVRKRRNVFTTKRLNIFTPSEITDLPTAWTTLWDVDYADHLSTVTNNMPRNGFEEMIQWTQEGKLWQYPIDNDFGLEEESNVPFHEHIFLDKYLQEGFPRQGPVRHFMELVISGLSRNPHLTVEQKKAHIFWFRDYFCQKEDVLNEENVFLN